MPLSCPPSLEAVSAYLLDLHRSSHELPPRAFLERAFEGLSELVPFDSGLVGTSTLQHGVPHAHDVWLYRQTPELMRSWERLKRQDRVALAALSKPGRTVAFAARTIFAEDAGALAHCQEFGVAHVFCSALLDSRAGSCTVVSLYRRDDDHEVGESERASIELVIPHLVEGMRRARLAEIGRATHTMLPRAHFAAIASRTALILEAEAGFVDLLAKVDPSWNGPWLPRSLAALVRTESAGRHLVGRLVVHVDPSDERVLLRARRATIADSLTSRELEVARLFSSGESTKETAARLEIAPNTVRAHVARIYEKLGVVNKAELATMLVGHDAP